MTQAVQIWAPIEPESTSYSKFIKATHHLHGGSTSADLQKWSVGHSDEFWSALWDFCEVVGEKGARSQPTVSLPDSRFFPDAQINLAENLLVRTVGVSTVDENDLECLGIEYSGGQLKEMVGNLVTFLKGKGVEPGDRIVSILPIGFEVLSFAIAGFELGAVVASASPEFGDAAILSRFSQLEPKVLVATTSYLWAGKVFDRTELISAVASAIPSLELLILVNGNGEVAEVEAIHWTDIPHSVEPLTYTRRSFDHPAYVLFTSGTTGAPKGLIHRSGGVLLKHLAEQRLHCDIREGDRVAFYTTTGWMMWNWEISVLASGATLVLFDGSPSYPDTLQLFRLAKNQRITHLGVSARLLDVIKESNLSPADIGPFPHLRSLMVTGSPLSADTAQWISTQLGSRVHISPFSGGTDLVGCFVGPDPLKPAYAGQMQGPILGMDVDVWDENGESCPPDVLGELVCKRPFPSVPLGIWGDKNGERFKSTYFDTWDGIWVHGDLASWTTQGGIVIHGRSDATLNVSGVRIGTGEIYSALEGIERVSSSLAFTQPWDGDERIVLLAVLSGGISDREDLKAQIKRKIRSACSPRHVPGEIYFVSDLPRTFNGKLAEVAVADLAHGRAVRNLTSLANPETLDEISKLLTAPSTS
ncbi:MAG TPA: acetoacetate--CoA ligase [Candidatus Paceibacterota bacterium]|nr:acetoacetate--CoA ligase [Candidatus Paceibacterota bacterium]